MFDDKKLRGLIGARIKQLRRMQTPEMNQEKLGEALGLTRTSITNIEKGKQKLTVDTLYKLCDIFSVEVTDLIPTFASVAIAQETKVVVGDRSFEVPAKTAEFMNSLRPAATAAAAKNRK